MKPNYDKIYTNIIQELGRYEGNKITCLLNKKDKNALDVIKLNELLFEPQTKNANKCNHRHRAYDIDAISEILKYQKQHNLNNSQLACHFKISRTTIQNWKRKLMMFNAVDFE